MASREASGADDQLERETQGATRVRELERGRLTPEEGMLTWLQDSLDMISLMATVAVPGLPQFFLSPAPSLIFSSGTVGLKKTS